MRAVRIHAFGAEVQIDDVPEPEPAEDEVLIDIRFAGVNPLDVWVTDGTVADGKQRLPFVPGVEAAGDAEGRAVLASGLGLGVTRDGLYRERAAVPRSALSPVPNGLDLRQAAALGLAGATAWNLVGDVARVSETDRVLVLGASGGVGSLVTQLARAAGARVWGQTTSEDKAAFVEEMGAEHAVVASAEDLVERAAGLRPTVVFDPLADGYTVAGLEAISPFGRLVLYGASAGPRAEIDLRSLYRKSIQLLSYSGTIEPEERIRAATERVLAAAAGGLLRVPIDEVLPLEAAARAHHRIRERRVRGKLVLAP